MILFVPIYVVPRETFVHPGGTPRTRFPSVPSFNRPPWSTPCPYVRPGRVGGPCTYNYLD